MLDGQDPLPPSDVEDDPADANGDEQKTKQPPPPPPEKKVEEDPSEQPS